MLQRIDRFMDKVFQYCPGVIAWPLGIAMFIVVWVCTPPRVFTKWRDSY